MSKVKFGCCPCCMRVVHLTFHHFIPKKVHRRNFFKKNYSKHALSSGMSVCRRCHDGIHTTYDEMTLAKKFTTVEKILSDSALLKHFHWVSRQKTES